MSTTLTKLPKTVTLPSKDLTHLERILKEWYCDNSDALFTDKRKPLMVYLNSLAKDPNIYTDLFMAPEFLYRAISFETNQQKSDMLKNMKESGQLKHPTKDYDSWTSSLDVAHEYAFGDKASYPNGHSVILKVPHSAIYENILFTIEVLFTGKNDKTGRIMKQQFFRKILNNKLNNLVTDLKESRYQKNQWDNTIKDMEKLIPGLSRALTEFEYILKPVKADSIKILMQTKK